MSIVDSFLYRGKFGINLIIVLDGLIPRYLSDKDKILDRSKNVWDKHGYNDDNNNLKVEILKNYGVRFYHQEIVRISELNHPCAVKCRAEGQERVLCCTILQLAANCILLRSGGRARLLRVFKDPIVLRQAPRGPGHR